MTKNKDYYAVTSGRIDEPTIFSSWGDAHPRVTGCSAVHKSFFTIEKARKFMAENGIFEWKEVIKATALETTPEKSRMAYYVVAHGANPGIREVWYGRTGALEAIHEISGACHKRFKTKAQAAAFIEDWKNSFADVWRREVKRGLEKGLRPDGMQLSTRGILHEAGEHNVVEVLAEQLRTTLALDAGISISDT